MILFLLRYRPVTVTTLPWSINRLFHIVTHRDLPLHTVTTLFLIVIHRFLPLRTIVFLPEFFGNKNSEKHKKIIQTNRIKQIMNTVNSLSKTPGICFHSDAYYFFLKASFKKWLADFNSLLYSSKLYHKLMVLNKAKFE